MVHQVKQRIHFDTTYLHSDIEIRCKMDKVCSVEEMLGLKCPELVVNEVEIETSERPVEIQSNSTVNTKVKEKKDVPFFEPADYKSGARFDELNYCWSQTINELGKSVTAVEFRIELTESEKFQKFTSACRRIFA